MDPQEAEARSRAALDELPGVTWRRLVREDLPAVLDLYAASEAYDGNPERQSLEGLHDYWDSPRSKPERDLLLGVGADGAVVALAWGGCNDVVTERRGSYLGGVVHPDHRGRGIGRALLRWEVDHALAWDAATREPGFGPLVARLHAPTAQDDVRDLAERLGLPVARYYFEMSRPLAEPFPEAHVDGIAFVDWDPARSAEVHRVIDLAFHDHWGHADRTDEMWQETITAHAFRPAWSVLAIDTSTDEVVGVALNCAYEQDWAVEGRREGYTDELGVARTHRGRGIAGALLHASMRRFADDDMDAAALSVDAANPTGALRLYEALGYRQTASTCLHQLEART